MKTAMEWEREYAHGHPNWTYAEFARAIQADTLEAAALATGAIQNAIAVDAQAERSVNPKADASVALKEIALLGAAMAAIRKLKETP